MGLMFEQTYSLSDAKPQLEQQQILTKVAHIYLFIQFNISDRHFLKLTLQFFLSDCNISPSNLSHAEELSQSLDDVFRRQPDQNLQQKLSTQRSCQPEVRANTFFLERTKLFVCTLRYEISFILLYQYYCKPTGEQVKAAVAITHECMDAFNCI